MNNAIAAPIQRPQGKSSARKIQRCRLLPSTELYPRTKAIWTHGRITPKMNTASRKLRNSGEEIWESLFFCSVVFVSELVRFWVGREYFRDTIRPIAPNARVLWIIRMAICPSWELVSVGMSLTRSCCFGGNLVESWLYFFCKMFLGVSWFLDIKYYSRVVSYRHEKFIILFEWVEADLWVSAWRWFTKLPWLLDPNHGYCTSREHECDRDEWELGKISSKFLG